MNLGETLRRARETKGLTCEAVAGATRIPLRMILAIEKEEWSKLPGGIFTRGYLRAYAREVGIEGAPVVAQFEAEHAPPPPAATEVAEPDWVGEETRDAGGRWPRWNTPAIAWSRPVWPALAAGVLLVLYFTAGRTWLGENQGGSTPASPERAEVTPADSLGGPPAAPVGTAASSASLREPGDINLPPPGMDTPLAIEFAVTRPCWVALTVDGSREIFRTVQPGERERQEGREFVIRAGDAGALQLAFDGEAARPLGAPGEVITVRITRNNYRSLRRPLSDD